LPVAGKCQDFFFQESSPKSAAILDGIFEINKPAIDRVQKENLPKSKQRDLLAIHLIKALNKKFADSNSY
jgi:hypothetical protein